MDQPPRHQSGGYRQDQGNRFSRRPGDWDCTCGDVNHSYRVECRKCQAPRTTAAPVNQQSNWEQSNNARTSSFRRPGDWVCDCEMLNFATRMECFRCKKPRPEQVPAPQSYAANAPHNTEYREPVYDYRESVDQDRGSALLQPRSALLPPQSYGHAVEGPEAGYAGGRGDSERGYAEAQPLRQMYDQQPRWNDEDHRAAPIRDARGYDRADPPAPGGHGGTGAYDREADRRAPDWERSDRYQGGDRAYPSSYEDRDRPRDRPVGGDRRYRSRSRDRGDRPEQGSYPRGQAEWTQRPAWSEEVPRERPYPPMDDRGRYSEPAALPYPAPASGADLTRSPPMGGRSGGGGDEPCSGRCPPGTCTNAAVYLGGLPFDMGPADVETFLRPARVVTIKLHTDQNGRSNGSGIARFTTAEEAHDVSKKLDGTLIRGRALKAVMARRPGGGR